MPLLLRCSLFLWLVGILTSSLARGQTATVRSEAARWVLGNAAIVRVIEMRPHLCTVEIRNLTGEAPRRHDIDSREFVLALDGEKLLLNAADFDPQPPQTGKYIGGVQLVVPLRSEKHGVGVTVTYRLGHEDFYVRKQLHIDPGDHVVNWVDVESLRLDEEDLRRFDRQPMPFPMSPWDITRGRPVFAGSEFFLGVEHPASENSFDDRGWISLRQYPGRKGAVATSPAVIGVCPDQPRRRLLDCFERYIDENRGRPVKRTVQWVAYFRSNMDDDACRAKIDVAEKVFRRRDAPLDVVLMDSGWTDPKSIMKIAPERPDRLDLMSKLVQERLGAKLGLHVITSGVKAMVDKDYLASQGYDMIYHRNPSDGAYCFADPRVLAEFRENLLGYLRQHDIAAYKFDWGEFACGQPGHRGHLPGKPYGFEAGATNFLQAQQAFRQANSEVFLFNTGWYSPWWLWTYDAVFTAGADYNFGLDGPPSFDTSSLLCSWRDATIRGNMVRWSPFFPINSAMTVDPISYWWQEWDVRAESPLRPFTDYFLTACLRGTQMIEIYNNISAWSEAHADAAAAILKWMKAHDDVLLASTRYFGGDPLQGDAYGYAHFTRENRGIILARNPSLEPRTIDIPFDESTGMWPGDGQYAVRIVYPYTMALARTVRYGSTHRQRLWGHEAMVLEVWPLDALPEPMPLGRRYDVAQRQPGRTVFRLEPGPATLDILSPVKIVSGTPVAGQPMRYTLPARSVASGLAAPPDAAHVDSSGLVGPLRVVEGYYTVPVRVAKTDRARVAFQFAQPKLEGEMLLDGKPVAFETPHLRLSDAKDRREGVRARAANWSLFGLDVGPGEHEVRFRPASAPEQGVLVLIDVRHPIPPTQVLEVAHEPTTTKERVRLPQNWAWEARCMDHASCP
jgi:hypothetical protein